MLQFNILKFTTPWHLHIDAQVIDLAYYDNVYIDKIIIDTDETVLSSGPSDSPLYTETFDSSTRSISKDIDILELLDYNPAPRMLFVYLVAGGTPLAATPCGMDNIYTVKAVAHLQTVYKRAVDYIKCGPKCGCASNECTVSPVFANFALEYFKLKSCIDLGMNTEALESFNRLMGRTAQAKTVYSNCGCDGS